ncbi:peroxisomal succinyl-coenzyme A thioesterase-like [Hemiscyllium ocellatum]|uniref:peroxisomal succinyl-coenzyme A thioesterase-like n=1 Tax=Hemiscyllium ocellatum TaxID=170820 RepID=UPI002966D52F|nr:peroxisomal succinyl-coenzyme A thioesterase-like [Hemiscyllium ocellatum]
MSVSIQLQPSPRCLFDEPLEVRVSGLSPLQQVTLKAWLRDDKEQLFHSAAFYTADPRGQLDLAHSPSLGGHYTGVQPMGLFWSLSPVTPFTRLVKRDVATSPLSVHIEIFEGHWSLGQLPAQPLATAINQRWFMKEGLLRIPVREGRIRGTLFIPPGNGPFPGVISVNEIKGGLLEYRSSLLANHGFTTLVLAYHNYDDLPKGMINLDLGYFEEAVHFLKQHPKVKGPGVGAIGISKGADLVLSMAAFLPDVRAAVVINGCITSAEFGLCFKNKLISTGLRHTVSRMKIADSGVADVSEVINEVDKDSIIPIENTKGTILFIAGEEDKNWNSKHYVDEAVKRLKEHGNDGFEVLRYRGSGHYLEPPFFPFCYASYHSVLNICTKWGGNAKDHSSAQVESWQKIQAFFRKILHQ